MNTRLFSWGKTARAWSLPLTVPQCWGYEWVALYFHSPALLLVMWRDNFTFTLTSQLAFPLHLGLRINKEYIMYDLFLRMSVYVWVKGPEVYCCQGFARRPFIGQLTFLMRRYSCWRLRPVGHGRIPANSESLSNTPVWQQASYYGSWPYRAWGLFARWLSG
jgi:hypothetical protein